MKKALDEGMEALQEFIMLELQARQCDLRQSILAAVIRGEPVQ